MNRDWQQDMDDCEQALIAYNRLGLDDHKEPIEAMKYWLQKYVEEKERAIIAELAYKGLAGDCVTSGEYKSLHDKYKAMREAQKAEKERADRLEKAIKEALEWTWGCGPQNVGEIEAILREAVGGKE
ncbi:hypothetical protein [Paenibacillus gallinarum]|uniref:Uncharacterized protein n=1 Tax=Paenibacillus gallinarum TaxID=2762232 RepID=A0ABR8SW54_9BACL|nr:hypothetical protein [Paenibacillus gallinarum]MBD7967741.1 hypothetical protein [Paenibacillus gallinarum]